MFMSYVADKIQWVKFCYENNFNIKILPQFAGNSRLRVRNNNNTAAGTGVK